MKYAQISFPASVFLLFSLFLNNFANAQWQKVSSLNVGTTGKIVSHGQAILLYGSQSGPRLHRSTNNGDSWEEISGGLPGAASDIFSFNGTLYAVYLSTVYTSTNLGETWTPLSSVTVTGNGALIGMAADGATLFAFSNRKSVFRSTNNGSNWNEYIINDPGSFTMVDFCAVGNRFAATVTGGSTVSGAWISEDGGTNWTRKNPTTAASNIYAHNNIVYGLTFGGGVFRMESGSSNWTESNNGMPDNGQFVIPYSVTSRANELYVYYIQLVSNRTGVLVSTTNGQSWTQLDSTGFPPANAAGTSRRLAANATHMFFYNYATTAAGGVYRAVLSPSAVEYTGEQAVPDEFVLHQNYPNPFNPATTIRFSVPATNLPVRLRVFDVLGREMAEIVNERLEAGTYQATFYARNIASGNYFYRLEIDGRVQTRLMTLVK